MKVSVFGPYRLRINLANLEEEEGASRFWVCNTKQQQDKSTNECTEVEATYERVELQMSCLLKSNVQYIMVSFLYMYEGESALTISTAVPLFYLSDLEREGPCGIFPNINNKLFL